MTLLPFVSAQHDLSLAMHGHHVPWLVMLSLLMAILAAYTSLSHTELIKGVRESWQRTLWHASGALAMGLGVWAMHFIGMISFELAIDVFYSPFITAISVLPAVLAAWITLHILRRDTQSWRTVLAGGVLMGAGIGAMHYTGMAAIQTQADMRYLPLWFGVSIVVAVVLAAIALATRSTLGSVIKSENLLRLVSAVIMGLAISGMHYTAMHATVFLPLNDPLAMQLSGASANQLIFITLIVAMFIVMTSTVVVVLMSRQQKLERTAHARGEEVQLLTERLQRVAERVPGMVFELHREKSGFLTFRYLSEAARQLFGVAPEEALQDSRKILQQMPGEDRARIVESLGFSARTLQAWNYEFSVTQQDGTKKWLYATATPFAEVGEAVSFSGFITDITDKKKDEETIHRLAFYDSLTGLPNRRHFLRDLNDRLSYFAIQPQCVIVWTVNLDSFKRINDVHGQHQGDALLKACARRLENVANEQMTLARLTADEFVLVTTTESKAAAKRVAESVAQEIVDKLSAPFDLPRLRHQGTASVGALLIESDEVGAEEIIRRADLAVHHAKQHGGGQWQYYEPGIEEEVSARFALEVDLREALARNELQLFYQLQVNERGEYLGAEALMRWFHPTRGMVSPGVFIPVAEESGLIVALGEWALTQACTQLSQWQQRPETKHLSLSVNVSPRQFYQHDFVECVLNDIQQSGIEPSRLKLELTESLVLEDMQVVVDKMRQLKAHGVRFSMDDFGTGYSSLSYLSFLPFDEVKIDQAFIRRAAMEEHARDWTIVEAIIGITRNLGMEVIAEGVETQAQCERLKSSGCFRYQGYLFSKPSPISELPI